MTPAIDITAEQRRTVLALLNRHLPDTATWVYGSRVKGTSRPASDLDLVVFAGPKQSARVAELRDAFEESDLPFRVDLFVWDEVPESFRKHIEAEHLLLAEKEQYTRERWSPVALGDCIEINDSTYTPKEAWPFVNYLDTGNITENRITEIQHLIAGKDKIPSRARRKVQSGDIVYSTVRPNQKHFGLLKKIPGSLLASTGFSVIRGKADVAVTDFIYWFLAQDRIIEQLHTIAEHSTSAYPSIRPADIERLTLNLPPLSEQRAIAHILGALDDKIELNRRMNETLEAMARALFQSWFVDFDPVRAKMEDRDTGLPKSITALFPDRISESELGLIPDGWEILPLPKLIEINPRRSLRKGEVAPYLDMANMPTKGHVPHAVVDRHFGSGMRFVNGDTLVARITPCLENGKTAYVDFLQHDEIGWGSTEYIVMRPMPPLPNEFAYYLARSTRFREFAIQNMTGTSGRQRVPAAALSQFLLPVPPEPIAESFGKFVRPLAKRVNEAESESRILANLRDTLLPKLISGEIRLRDAERQVEDVA